MNTRFRSRNLPQPWQTNPEQLQVDGFRDTVQFWSGGQMVSCQMPITEARLLVESGNAFVISSVAIGLLTDGRMDS